MMNTRSLSRRPHVERQVLAILRGREGAAGNSRIAGDFARLRDLAQAGGHPVLPVGTLYLGNSELLLLSWLAVAQRIIAPKCEGPSQTDLASAIAACADTLISMGLRLYPISFYAHRLRQSRKASISPVHRDYEK
ncbi:hypothetical protein [Sphingobium yanoikuyae]|uniref:hypothetical protein n=1 Tax=Sphingobium yanoikuyae TaxID=13690 RepID=UPI0028A89126|nr:hypothetical protein [Sphingobium yanoikuyae]